MTLAVRSLTLALLLTPALAWSQQARQPAPLPEPPGKEGLDYVMINASLMDYASIGPTDADADSHAAGIALGTYITDHFKAELRAGGGFSDGEAQYDYGPADDRRKAVLDVSMPYYVSWYMGVLYPWTDFSHIYGQFGFSYVKAEAETDTPRRFEDIEDDLYGSKFSVSWLVGVDLQLIDSTYLLLEGGRLHTDTETDINTMQYTLGLRYEF